MQTRRASRALAQLAHMRAAASGRNAHFASTQPSRECSCCCKHTDPSASGIYRSCLLQNNVCLSTAMFAVVIYYRTMFALSLMDAQRVQLHFNGSPSLHLSPAPPLPNSAPPPCSLSFSAGLAQANVRHTLYARTHTLLLAVRARTHLAPNTRHRAVPWPKDKLMNTGYTCKPFPLRACFPLHTHVQEASPVSRDGPSPGRRR